MSSVTTQPKILTSVPSKPNARSLAEGSPGYCRNGAGTGGDRRVERRSTGRPGDSPIDILRRLPAVLVLERLAVPTVAIAGDGITLFTNMAFAEMVGYPQDTLAGLAFPQLFHTVPATLCALSGVDALTNLVVELRHREGWTVRARMSKSALLRCDDPVLLVTFEDLTEQLWMDERSAPGSDPVWGA